MNLLGIWTYYNSQNSPLPQGMQIGRLVAGAGRIWMEVVEPFMHIMDGLTLHTINMRGILLREHDKWHLFSLGEIGLPPTLRNARFLACDHAGRLWIHAAVMPPASLICYSDGQSTKVFHSGEFGLPSDLGTLTNCAFDWNGDFWAAMGLMGVYYFDGMSWQKFPIEDYQPVDGWVTNVIADHMGRLWFAIQASDSTSFVWYDGRQCYTHAEASVGYEKARVQALAADKAGRLWVGWGYPLGTEQVGLWRLDKAGSDWTRYTSRNSALPSDQIETIAFDRKERAWVGTVGGVTIFDDKDSVCWGAIKPGLVGRPIRQDDVTKILDTEIALGKPLSYIFINSEIVTDSQGRIWAGSHNGVSVFTEE